MLSFKNFRKETGFTCRELEEITGYTRQNLDVSFKNIENGIAYKKFLACLDIAIKTKMEIETKQFDKRMDSLKELKHKLATLIEDMPT
ncbi:hypothetical protein [Clostridium estertheticum]|uniref:hypothetical protein n=1 Tax=Clostridium estertheticum TaxID=238834 RepID=UPI001C7CB0A4|nr:hypothetical protein [Clostridium estertheticum]MBX4267163.1 hypothetical protein [Clostridium estertheticum]MBX4272030.1 hypothetical protein [Clostridium estertheticum]WLC82415.1 hypothetical protein KTC98_24120 [Clostridium estertheticum]WLC91286.1 hypothetical protein KTC95_24080 [Clostridium estertheticum]